MAFGFTRLPGTAKRYQNVANPDFDLGQVLPYRQYANYINRQGLRQHLPGVHDAALQLLKTENELLRLRAELAEQRVAELEGLIELEATAKRQRSVFERVRSTGAGQRGYWAAVKAYQRHMAEQGVRLTTRQVQAAPRFREAEKLRRGKPNPTGNPNVAARNAEGRRRAFEMLGGGKAYREQYERQYGRRPARRATRGTRIRRANRG